MALSKKPRQHEGPLPPAVRETLTASSAQLSRPALRASSVGSMSSGAGLNAVLETAALMHASGQPEAAKTVLEEAIASEPETAAMPLVWLALLDLYQQLGNRKAFERYGMEYAVRFEQSPPVWVARAVITDAVATSPATRQHAASSDHVKKEILLTGDIAAANKMLLAPLLQALLAPEAGLRYRVNLMRATLLDEGGALRLAHVLGKARRQQFKMTLEPWPQALLDMVEKQALTMSEKQGEGYWQLWLELLQWCQDDVAFEECALDFALRFEVSPPAWEPVHGDALSAAHHSAPAAVNAEEDMAALQEAPVAPNVIVWRGILHGAHAPQLSAFKKGLLLHDDLVIDLRDVPRIDFSYGGALANLVLRADSAKKQVTFIRTSPMVLTLLLLVGIPARLFGRRRK